MSEITMKRPAFYQKTPVVRKAIKYNGTDDSYEAVVKFLGSKFLGRRMTDNFLDISTNTGIQHAHPGSWIIQETDGSFYPCPDNIFSAHYRLIPDMAPVVASDEEEEEELRMLIAQK